MYKTIESDNPDELYQRLAAKAEHTVPSRTYWWAIAQVKGRAVIVGKAETEEEITNMCLNRGADDFETFELPTKSEQRATRMLKAIRLKRGANFERALEKVRHKI